MEGEFLKIHRSKLELDPCGDRGQPSIWRITHCVFLFRVRKDPLNVLRTQRIGCFAKRRMPDIFRPIYVILPDVARHSFSTLLALGTTFTDRAALINVAFTPILSISIPVGGCITQNLVLRTKYTIVIFIINIFIPRKISLLCHRALIRQGWDSSAVKYLLAYPWRFISSIGRDYPNLRMMFYQSLKYRIKRNTIVNIPGSYLRLQYITAPVAYGMRLICEALFVLTLMEHSAFRVRGGFSCNSLLT